MRRTIAAACPQLTDRYRLIVRVFRRALLCFVYVAYSKEKEYNEKSHYRQTISYSKGLPLLFFRHLSLTYIHSGRVPDPPGREIFPRAAGFQIACVPRLSAVEKSKPAASERWHAQY